MKTQVLSSTWCGMLLKMQLVNTGRPATWASGPYVPTLSCREACDRGLIQTNPSPGPQRLVKALVAVHPLPLERAYMRKGMRSAVSRCVSTTP